MEKVYITKYALTTGILEIEAEIMKSYWDKYPGYVKDEEGELYYLCKDALLMKMKSEQKKRKSNIWKNLGSQ